MYIKNIQPQWWILRHSRLSWYVGMSASHTEVQVQILATLLPVQISVNAHPERQQMMTQILGSLPLMWET